MDIFSPEKRSQVMSLIKSKDTKPEKIIRSILHKLGFRFRINRKDLPGKPDIILPKYKTVIFVHGCFWHQHKGCKYASLPKTNSQFWEKKLFENHKRDKRIMKEYEKTDWKVLVLWQCEIRNIQKDHYLLKNMFPKKETL